MESKTKNEIVLAQLLEGKTITRVIIPKETFEDNIPFTFELTFSDGTSVTITSESNMTAWQSE